MSNNELNELIVCSAISLKISNGIIDKSIIVTGNRHYDKLMVERIQLECAYMQLNSSPNMTAEWRHLRESEVQGFMTNKFRFVDRKEAMEIALKNNQIRRVLPSVDQLYSEHLY